MLELSSAESISSIKQILNIIKNQSKATRLKVGCIIIKNGAIISSGYNMVPTNINQPIEINNKTNEDYLVHAEMNAVLTALKNKIDLKDSIMIVTNSPCPRCSKHIFNLEFKEIYYLEKYRITDHLENYPNIKHLK